MSTQIYRVVELMIRSTCCHRIRSRSCLRKGVLFPVVPSGLCTPGAPVLQRRAYSRDALSSGQPTIGQSSEQPCEERSSPSSALTHRNLSAVAVQGQCRPLCPFDLDIEDAEENMRLVEMYKPKSYTEVRHFIIDPHVANLVTEHLGPEIRDAKTVVFDCNPGPGVLTKALLNAGAQRVVALEGNKYFVPHLKELERRLDGQLEVLYCDYFKLDPIGDGHCVPPALRSDVLFTHLGISAAKWTDDVSVKVVGILPQNKQRNLLLKMIYALFEQLSVYKYGRIELNLFISEKEYMRLVSHPGEMVKYRAFTILWQMACDIELLHKEPWESFVSPLRRGAAPRGKVKSQPPNDHLCLVRLRPRADLFSGGLTSSNAFTLLTMVKQCMAKQTVMLINKLNLWSPDSGRKLLAEMGMPEDTVTGHVRPEEYLRLFQLMEKSQEFTQSWLYEEVLDNIEDV